MNLALRTRPPLTPLREACPEYRQAIEEYERLLAAGKEDQATAKWAEATRIAEIFHQGAAFGAQEARRG